MSDLLKNYLSDFKYQMFFEHYSDMYINSFDLDNFIKVYTYLENVGFDFIDDIIINYAEIFKLSVWDIYESLKRISKKYGPNYIDRISKDMRILEMVLD